MACFDVNEEKLDLVRKELPVGRVLPLKVDVSDERAVHEAVDHVAER